MFLNSHDHSDWIPDSLPNLAQKNQIHLPQVYHIKSAFVWLIPSIALITGTTAAWSNPGHLKILAARESESVDFGFLDSVAS